MGIRAFKYFSPLLIYVGAMFSFSRHGFLVWLPLIYAWIAIPVAELMLKPNAKNLSVAEEQVARKDKTYDLLLYTIVLLQYLAIYLFLRSMREPSLSTADSVGRIWVMGLLCGTFGINVGHELGHRTSRGEQFLAKALLLSSLYMHFFIEHNKGHHKRVATKEDPSSARKGEWVYAFYFRSILFSYLGAWKIAARDARKNERRVLSIYNEMIVFQLIQMLFVATIIYFYGWMIAVYFIAAATIGILLLETVNYIEHYGLERKKSGDQVYERAMPAHSWNSDHVIGRLMLFELSRHSDHHYLASRKYQLLRHHDESPQMPTGYPGMMILSLVPPLWMHVMNKRIFESDRTSTRDVPASLHTAM
jgi:alkane 1-monooxygenase